MRYNTDSLAKRIEKRKKRKKIAGRIIYIILIFFFIINIILVIENTFNPKKVPNIFGFKMFTIVTDSMEPALNVNDFIITKNCKEEEIDVGDIISFRRGDNIITHRVDSVINEDGRIYYITKGDKNFILDEVKITYNSVEGKYYSKIPKIGKIASLLKNEKIVLGVIIILFIGNYYNCKRNKERIIRQEQRRKYERRIEEEKRP